MLQTQETYRVTGVYFDGSETTLWNHLTLPDALQLQSAWRGKLFEQLLINPERIGPTLRRQLPTVDSPHGSSEMALAESRLADECCTIVPAARQGVYRRSAYFALSQKMIEPALVAGENA